MRAMHMDYRTHADLVCSLYSTRIFLFCLSLERNVIRPRRSGLTTCGLLGRHRLRLFGGIKSHLGKSYGLRSGHKLTEPSNTVLAGNLIDLIEADKLTLL